MKKLLHVSLAIAVLVVLSFSSCSKGAKGDTGAAGATGAAGPDSVFSSAWVTLSMTFSSTDSDYEETITAASITQPILDSGVILTYIHYIDNNGNDNYEPATDYMGTTFLVGQIELFSNINFTNLAEFRYVTIPGALIGTTASPFVGLSKGQIKTLSYQQVNKLLGNTASVKTN